MNWYKKAQIDRTIWYHGGTRDFTTPGTFLSTTKEYAMKFSSQRGENGIYEIAIKPETRIYPTAYWWQDYEENRAFHEGNFAEYDAVPVIEPNGADDSIIIRNPSVITNIKYIENELV